MNIELTRDEYTQLQAWLSARQIGLRNLAETQSSLAIGAASHAIAMENEAKARSLTREADAISAFQSKLDAAALETN